MRNLNFIISYLMGLTFSIFAATHVNAETVGLRLFDIYMPHHGKAAESAFWYPAQSSGQSETVFENPVFKGVMAEPDAPLAEGHHPVILLSHGLGGSIRSVAWLARGLTARGATVISVSHLNSTWGSLDLSEGVKHWTRTQDLTSALDFILSHSDISQNLNLNNVMAAGFSFGGWTALSLGGAKANHGGLLSACDAEKQLLYCTPPLFDEINSAEINVDIWNADHSDPRIHHVAAIDPGLVWGLTGADLSNLVGSVTLIGLGKGTNRLSGTDFDASGFASRIPQAQIIRFSQANHFTAMPLCTTFGQDILKDDNDDPVCTDPPGADRPAVHQHIVAVLAEQIGLK